MLKNQVEVMDITKKDMQCLMKLKEMKTVGVDEGQENHVPPLMRKRARLQIDNVEHIDLEISEPRPLQQVLAHSMNLVDRVPNAEVDDNLTPRGSRVTSTVFWDPAFSHSSHIWEHTLLDASIDHLARLTILNSCTDLQAILNKATVLALSIEGRAKELFDEQSSAREEASDLRIKVAELKGSISIYAKEKSEVARLKSDLEKDMLLLAEREKEVEVKCQKLEEECDRVVGEVGTLRIQVRSATDQIDQLNVNLGISQVAQAEQFSQGFDAAMAQIRVLFPNADLSMMGCFKEVKDGAIVDVEDEEAEEEEDVEENSVDKNA